MACKAHSILFILSVLLSFTGNSFAERDIPTTSDNLDKKQPDSFIDQDGSVLVPGIGRFLIPDKLHLKGFNPFTYNPVTGTDGGTGIGIPSFPGGPGSAGTPTYIPGGDDTTVPNPGYEVPTGALPTPPARH